MFTKIFLIRFLVPLLVILFLVKIAPFSTLCRFKEKIGFDIFFRRALLALVLATALLMVMDLTIRAIMPNPEEETLRREGGRTGTLTPPVHGRRFKLR